jgi:hypothetical protein
MAQISPIVINITLDGSNYPEWSFCVETTLRGHGLYSHLTDDPPKSDGHNATIITTWQINDGKVMAAMINSIKQSMIMSLRKFKTAKQIWSALKQRYVQDSGALLHNLMQQIHVIEQGDMSIDDYYSAYDRLMGSLTSMVNECTAADCPAHKFIEKFLTYRFVMGVKPEFDSIRTRLLHNSSTLTMDQALAELLAEETCLQSMSSLSTVTMPHSVLAASQWITVPRGTSSEPCKHCGKTTHLSANCFSAYPEKLAEYRARRASRGRGPSSTARDGSVSGFSQSAHDPALFVHLSPRGRTLLLLYVDDMLITGDDVDHVIHVKQQLAEQFQMSDLGPLSYFLGIEVLHSSKGYYLSQSKYIRDLIARSGITDSRTVATPMDLHLQLRPTEGAPLEDPSRYRHIVGSLVYLTVTRPDIAHAVHILSQFVSAPTLVHFGHLLRVLRYRTYLKPVCECSNFSSLWTLASCAKILKGDIISVFILCS